MRFGSVQKKILLLAMTGIGLGFSQSPTRQFRILGLLGKEWKKINKKSVERAIQKLYESRLIELIPQKNGKWKMTLTDSGKNRALTYNLESIKIKKPKHWDKKWRLIIFDIPEIQKRKRDELRAWMKRLGFYKLQASVFVHPYDCKDEFDFLIEFLNLRRHVRFLVATEIDNQAHLIKLFSL